MGILSVLIILFGLLFIGLGYGIYRLNKELQQDILNMKVQLTALSKKKRENVVYVDFKRKKDDE